MSIEFFEQYEKAIPACCKFQTAKEHYEIIMLCWSVLAMIQDGRKIDCDKCEFATRKVEAPEDK